MAELGPHTCAVVYEHLLRKKRALYLASSNPPDEDVVNSLQLEMDRYWRDLRDEDRITLRELARQLGE